MSPRLRRHQALALDALDRAWGEGRRRAWVELPPGAGKTLVGLETAQRLLDPAAAAPVRKVVVLGPNTAIQGQWIDQAGTVGLSVGSDRGLTEPLTALTYQSLAVFDADAEVGDTPDESTPLMARLHDNGRALVEALREAGPLLLVLDECHHLLEVWGRLLGELLDLLPEAVVLGLTATPPETMTREQATLVGELFGAVVFETSIPAVVREGDLAPFAELAWLTVPTAGEQDWLASEATRFRELVTQLTDPEFGSLPFLSWLDARFRSGELPWPELVRLEPELAGAALRMHHAGLLALPDRAVPGEEHRRDPTADDWVRLVGDWLGKHLTRTGDERDDAVVAAVRRALPAVGYVWTKRGIRRGRSPVDRVLARSEAKTIATVAIVGTEHLNLGERLRMLVLCDHERASATLPVDLRGVIDQQSGSAHAVLTALLADPVTAILNPLLVTGATVAGAGTTLAALRSAALVDGLRIEPVAGGVHTLVGSWTSRDWVRVVTRFFEAGQTQVLVGTRGLLGEGWDARRITGLVDLTAVTTSTAVTQTRGRALRVDPHWPGKVALTWSVVCVSEEHPKGGNDWDRLVRKHRGFYGVDQRGDVVDGVAHLDPAFSAYAAPPVAEFDAVNARMTVRSEDRAAIRAAWQVGEPYADRVARTVRILPARPSALGSGLLPVSAAVQPTGLEVRTPRPGPGARTGGGGLALLVLTVVAVGSPSPLWIAAALLALLNLPLSRLVEVAPYGRAALTAAAEPPSIQRIAGAVADGLHAAALVSVGADHVEVDVDAGGEYRCLLTGVAEPESDRFATALDEALAPIGSPRYVVPRWVVTGSAPGWARVVRAAYGRVLPDGEVWHPVPTVLGANASRAAAYGAAWSHWVGGGDALYTGSPEGAGVLAAQRGSDPFDVSTVMRRHWT